MVKKNLILGDLKKDLIKRSLGKTPPTVKYTLLEPTLQRTSKSKVLNLTQL